MEIIACPPRGARQPAASGKVKRINPPRGRILHVVCAMEGRPPRRPHSCVLIAAQLDSTFSPSKMENHVDRKHPAHFAPLKSHNRAIIVFVTVCTWRRRSLLAFPDAHEHLCNVWESAPAWLVGRYVLMPDHLHLFCAAGSWPESSLENWILFWKSRTATTWPRPRIGRLWQRDFWDTQLRAGKNYDMKWECTRHNPVRAGLVKEPDDWPYQGEMHVLCWHD